MPTLVVETGLGVANANTYASVAALEAYAESRGYSIPDAQADKEVMLLIAMDYLGDFEYQGEKTSSENSLPWPRRNVYIQGGLFDEDAIPSLLVSAQCQLVVEQQKRTLLFPKAKTSTTEGFVTEKTVGPLTKKFAADGKGVASSSAVTTIASVLVFLKPLLASGNGKTLLTYRI